MSDEYSNLNIYQKLVVARKEVGYLQKKASGQQYDYVSSSQVLYTLGDKLNELNLLLIPKVLDKRVTADTVEYEQGGRPKRTTTYFTELDIEYTWINADNPQETIVCPWYGQGVDIAGEKGVGKALTYAEKYFMLKFFNIATDKDDPDSFQNKMEHDEKPSGKPNQQNYKQNGSNKPNQNSGNQSSQSDNTLTDGQKKAIFAISKEIATKSNVKQDDVTAELKKRLGFDHVDKLTKKQASQAIEMLNEWKGTKAS